MINIDKAKQLSLGVLFSGLLVAGSAFAMQSDSSMNGAIFSFAAKSATFAPCQDSSCTYHFSLHGATENKVSWLAKNPDRYGELSVAEFLQKWQVGGKDSFAKVNPNGAIVCTAADGSVMQGAAKFAHPSLKGDTLSFDITTFGKSSSLRPVKCSDVSLYLDGFDPFG